MSTQKTALNSFPSVPTPAQALEKAILFEQAAIEELDNLSSRLHAPQNCLANPLYAQILKGLWKNGLRTFDTRVVGHLLFFAVYNNLQNVVRALIWSLPKFCLLVDFGETFGPWNCLCRLLLIAAERGFPEIAELLCAAIRAQERQGGESQPQLALRQCVNEQHMTCDLNDGVTPLHAAALQGHVDVAKILLANHADSNLETAGDGKRNPLEIASALNHRAVQKLLQCWDEMPLGQREVVTTHGWRYFEMDPWHQQRHKQYPAHLRERTVAMALAVDHLLPQARGFVASLLTKALDAHVRHRAFRL
jgi:hypothetical protein